LTASFLASFLIFLVTGCYELFLVKTEFLVNQPMIRGFVCAILFINACYYYYFAAYTEMNDDVVKQLQGAARFEWLVRVINQTILFGLWFLLHFGWWYFGIGLLVLYSSYLFWDLLTWKHFPSHSLTLLDLIGLLITIMFLVVKAHIENPSVVDHTNSFFFLGGVTVFYLIIFVLGISRCKFNPFAGRYLSRPALH
jgi:hypothetical protein